MISQVAGVIQCFFGASSNNSVKSRVAACVTELRREERRSEQVPPRGEGVREMVLWKSLMGDRVWHVGRRRLLSCVRGHMSCLVGSPLAGAAERSCGGVKITLVSMSRLAAQCGIVRVEKDVVNVVLAFACVLPRRCAFRQVR